MNNFRIFVPIALSSVFLVLCLFSKQLAGLDSICGPRCVKHLMEHLGDNPNVDLLHLVRDIQGGDQLKGASLKSLQDFLAAQGFHTEGFRVRWFEEICCHNPILIHVLNVHQEGHFLVCEPDGAGGVLYWDGLSGYSSSWPNAYRMSGYCLSVSKEPITNKPIRLKTFWVVSPPICLALLFVTVKRLLFTRFAITGEK